MLGPLFSRFRRKKELSPYAGYNERMMSAAVDLFSAMILLRPLLSWLEMRITPHLQQALKSPAFEQQMKQAEFQDPITQMIVLVQAIFNTDVWWWMLINHGTAFLLIVTALAAMQYSMGTTPGKWLLGLKVTCRDMQTKPGPLRIILRYIACFFSCAVLMLGLVWTMFDAKKRSWHDIAAGTVVLNMRPDGWYWNQIKRGYRALRGKAQSTPTDEAVAQPPANERE